MVNFIFCNEGDDFYGSFSMFLDNSKEIKISGKSLKEIRIEGCKSHEKASYELAGTDTGALAESDEQKIW